jgi:D-sedoheptulose 7-phosphate isomerase
MAARDRVTRGSAGLRAAPAPAHGNAATPAAAGGRDAIERLLAARVEAGEHFFDAQAPRIARLCHLMAQRFVRGGRLIALGASGAAGSDARHVAVEFVHPVIVGKRALPAIALTGEIAGQAALLLEPEDVVIAFGEGTADALRAARAKGCLTIAFAADAAEWEFVPPAADPLVAQELVETLYHVLWELVHVFFEHRGLLENRPAGPRHDAGAASFLYPFLAEEEHDLDAVLADVAGSVAKKAAETAALRSQTLNDNAEQLLAAAAALRASLDGGGRVLALGNGGSATDAADLVADLRSPPAGSGWLPRAAIDLSEDPSILTAIANDIGPAAIFSRQVIAHGRGGDALVAFSTSGGSENVIDALAEARRRGIATIALVGYDGGAIAAGALADHVVVTRSQHIPRIQEAQASAYHVLRELVERDPPPPS